MHIYVGNLTLKVKSSELKKAFSKFGKVISANVYKNIYGGGYEAVGFVEMSDEEEAKKAMSELDGSVLSGHKIIVHQARSTEQNEGEYGQGKERRKDPFSIDPGEIDLSQF
ncbi:MAG: RNA-binding protein [Elusimicrobia bacterium]|nr:RNA-binding protein [Elusimicrobiota bacterium]